MLCARLFLFSLRGTTLGLQSVLASATVNRAKFTACLELQLESKL